MNCIEARGLLDAHLDGELDLVRSMEIDKHIEQCDDCAAACAKQLALGASLRESRFQPASPELRGRVISAIRAEASPFNARPWIAMAASLILVIGTAWLLLSRSPVNDALAEEIVSSHVRSMQADHLTDVASSDRHTVKPWFSGKLDFSPRVQDLAEQGFPLVGGRLDYLNHRPVAALVYRRQQHVINVFVWPANGANESLSESIRGFHTRLWTQDELTWCAISDVESGELDRLAELLRASAPASQP